MGTRFFPQEYVILVLELHAWLHIEYFVNHREPMETSYQTELRLWVSFRASSPIGI